ncbi:MAG TPA: hypothetical protein VM266_14960 [Solirubrobacteraceae bacterium]|nr:hypothetical protein [Solirubrobacteraceae bacterium]
MATSDARTAACRRFGWDGVAAGVIAAAQGRHDDLAPLPSAPVDVPGA